MTDKPFEIPETVETIAPVALAQQLADGEPIGILDTRAPDSVDDWRIDGPGVEFANVPYYEFLDGVTDDSLAALPDARPLYTVCAKGESSRFVADRLDDAGVDDVIAVADGMAGWERVLTSTELDVDTAATVVQFHRPASGCLSYLVVSGDEAVVVDPLRAFADDYVAAAADHGADLVAAVDTHVHADHVSGVRALQRDHGVPTMVPAGAVQRGLDYESPYQTIADGETISVGSVAIEAVHTPGHTSGMTSFLVEDTVLLTGDGLFVESVARPDLEDGDEGAPDAASQLYETLQERVLSLPEATVVAPGHASDGTPRAADGSFTARLGDIVDSLDVLTLERAAFVERVLGDMPPRPTNYEEIIATNLGEQQVADDLVAELERGPNNCAASADTMRGD
ncbi:MBL fold metallo-hydrolase [Haloarcula sp. S1AR25-5A]|uniref:MBL fold metallo-hydrolase n=1 Tax=Haloarcula terrestris TaxID=2950533 RepID=A0AAE4EXS0_9EURY|nr:MBL fold metallo-hydrolase [Haloarcula terrestris]MDS0221162.1 MBL fold metallo-hydrolase [Haloarcula terrestris]